MSRQALRHMYPKHDLVVLVALMTSIVLLLMGLSHPVLYTQQLVFWKDTYSVWTGILDLWRLKERALALIVFFFSMVFPFAKFAALVCIWYVRMDHAQRVTLLHWLGILGKWSMLDVFMVAILIVLVKIGSLAKIEPRIGIYYFGAAILCSMLTTMYVDRLARRAVLPGAGRY